MSTGDSLGFASLVLSAVTFAVWYRRIQRVSVPRRRAPWLAVMAISLLLGVAAFSADAGIAGGIAAGLGIAGGAIFLGLRLQSAQESRRPAVAVGGSMLDFTAPDENGEPFALASLAGSPFLLKFFRGHW